jgi:predicted Zn-dependent peptidase
MNGISHFLEHLLFKGTRTRTSRQIKESIEGTGGVLNAFTDEEFTCVWAKVQPKRLHPTLAVLTDMVLHSSLESREIGRERQVVLEEIRMYKDLPMQYVHDLLNTLLWPNHPLGMILAGTEKSVGRIGRKELLSFQRRFYTPCNIVIAACGRHSHRDLVEGVQRLWGKVPPGRRQISPRIRQQQRRPRLKVEKKETEQTHISLGFHAFPRNHPQVHALNLMNIVLGGNMSSRLFQKVREERGLCYEIGSQVKRYRDTGFFSVSAGVEHRKLLPCLRVVLKELGRIRREPVAPKEFEEAREFFIGQLLFSLEDTVDQMCWVGESEMLLNRVEPAEAVLSQVQRVRRSDLKEAARSIVRQEHLSLAAIGPIQEKVSSRMAQMLDAA